MTNGQVLYRGHHTKGSQDGKWITYKGYSYEFFNYTVDKFRLSPNVYDIMDATDVFNESIDRTDGIADGIDVYLSYCKMDCPSFLLSDELQTNPNLSMPPSYREATIQDLVDPRDLARELDMMSCTVKSDEKRDDPKVIAQNIKKCKVFVACLSNEYVNDKACVDEFIYAKKHGAKAVIPIGIHFYSS